MVLWHLASAGERLSYAATRDGVTTAADAILLDSWLLDSTTYEKSRQQLAAGLFARVKGREAKSPLHLEPKNRLRNA